MLNKIELIGRLTKDPERRGNDPQKPIAHFRLAVDRDFKREGEPEADFFDVSAFGRQAEAILQYLHKGRLICVVGAMQFRDWEDQTGVKRTTAEVKLSEFHFLEKKDDSAAQQTAPAVQTAPRSAPAAMPQAVPAAAPATSPTPQQAATYIDAGGPSALHYPQPVPGAAAQYPMPDFSGVPVSYGPGGAPVNDTPF